MGNNNRNYQIFSVLLNESEEGISFAVASAKLQKKLVAPARAGQVAAFDFLDLPEEERNYTFSNIEPVFMMHPNFTSYLFFNTQEALKTRQDYITLNFSRDLLIRTHKNIIFFVTKEVYENVVRIAHDLNSSIKLRVFFEDEETDVTLKADGGKYEELAGNGQTAEKMEDAESKDEIVGDVYAFETEGEESDVEHAADKGEMESGDDIPGGTMEKLRKDLLRGRTTVVFGRYPQGANGEVEPLTWRVLDVKGSRILIITEKLIDAVPYNEVFKPVTWKTSTLRRWMNVEFIWEAFNEDEVSHIVVTKVEYHNNGEDGQYRGGDTLDRVFALDIGEIRRYFFENNYRLAEVTPYAIVRGSRYRRWIDRRYPGLGKNPQKMNVGWWWLRTPDIISDDFAYVIGDDGVFNSGFYVNDPSVSVRPALWLHL